MQKNKATQMTEQNQIKEVRKICDHKFCLIQKYHAFLLKNLVFKSENRHQYIEFDNTWGYNRFQKYAFFTDF